MDKPRLPIDGVQTPGHLGAPRPDDPTASAQPDWLAAADERPDQDFSRPAPRVRRSVWPIAALVIALILTGTALAGWWYWGSGQTAQLNSNGTNAQTGNRSGSFLASFAQRVLDLFGGPQTKLRGQERGRTNLLLLGSAGLGHDGPNLTDSNLLVSLNHRTKEVAVLYLPRDLVVPMPNGLGTKKLNSAFAYGEALAGDGLRFATQVFSQFLGQPIDYSAQVDFRGLVRLVDDLGGIDVAVERTFTDSRYPTDNFGYQTVSFSAGQQHFDGDQALKFVRSRHGDANEGSDFARGHRMQLVLEAIRDRVLSYSTLINPRTMHNLVNDIAASIQTDLGTDEALSLVRLAKRIPRENIFLHVLDNDLNGPLTEITGADGAYLLVPKNGDYQPLRDIAGSVFQVSGLSREGARIAIRNGNGIVGQATELAQRLSSYQLRVVEVGNADSFQVPQTAIYDQSGKSKPLTRTLLTDLLSASITDGAAPLPPLGNGNSAPAEADFVIVLGRDQLTQSLPRGRTSPQS